MALCVHLGNHMKYIILTILLASCGTESTKDQGPALEHELVTAEEPTIRYNLESIVTTYSIGGGSILFPQAGCYFTLSGYKYTEYRECAAIDEDGETQHLSADPKEFEIISSGEEVIGVLAKPPFKTVSMFIKDETAGRLESTVMPSGSTIDMMFMYTIQRE